MRQMRHVMRTGAAVLVALMTVAPVAAQAGDVTVTEGETATFQITVTRSATAANRVFNRDSRIRVYYASDGGTATPGFSDHGVGVDGADHQYLNPWTNYAQGRIGHPLRISVRTHRDDLVEGDETVKIKVVGIRTPFKGWWHNTRFSDWTITGLPTITITDATPPPTAEEVQAGQSANQPQQSSSSSGNTNTGGCGRNAGGC